MQPNTIPAFSDSRVFIVGPNDPNCNRYHADTSTVSCYHWQADEGPTYIVVGPAATEEQLTHLAGRFKLSAKALVAFRDGRQ